MKKLVAVVIIMFLSSTAIGLSFRQTYTHIDFNDKSQLDKFSVWVLEDDELEETSEIEQEVINNSGPVVTYEDEETGEISEVDENEYKHFAENNTFYNNEEMISYNEQSLEDYFREVLRNCDYVVRAKKLYGTDVFAGALSQKILIEEVYCGDNTLEGEIAYLMTTQEIIYMGDSENRIGSFVNLMQEGDEYLVFMNKAPSSSAGNIFYIPEIDAVCYFNLKEIENEILEDKEVVNYEEVNENEFFAANQEVLEKIITLKKEVISEYIWRTKCTTIKP